MSPLSTSSDFALKTTVPFAECSAIDLLTTVGTVPVAASTATSPAERARSKIAISSIARGKGHPRPSLKHRSGCSSSC